MIIALAVGAVILLVGLSVRGLFRTTLSTRTRHNQGVREDMLARHKAIKKSARPINVQKHDPEDEDSSEEKSQD